MANPFSFVRSVVSGDLFVGRKDLLKELEERVSGNGSANIVGLPRMGKSSLIEQCFFYGERFSWWVTNYRLLPVLISLDTQRTAVGLWGFLATSLRSSLRKVDRLRLVDPSLTTRWRESLSGVMQCSTADDRYSALADVFDDMGADGNLHVVLILDEFDSIIRYRYTPETLSQLRNLGAQKGRVVTCSRRHPEVMEKTISGAKYFFNINTVLYVGLFSEKDTEAYWDRFSPAFAFMRPDVLLQYKDLMHRYVGRHPMLMSLMNYEVFLNDAALLNQWIESRSARDRLEIERRIRIDVHTAMEEQLHYLEEQELIDTAVRLVVGGMGKPDQKLSMYLQDYQFVQRVPSQVKHDLFGYDFGYREGMDRFVCFSDFASHQMRDLYDPLVEGYDLLKKTELLLRELVRSSLYDLVDDDPFGQLPGKDGYMHERWEEPFHRKYKEWVGKLPVKYRSERMERMKQQFDDMLNVWDKRFSNDYKPSHESEIDIVSSSSLGQLWSVFMEWQWDDFFADVLSDSPRFRMNAGAWYNECFFPILSWRNAVNHFRDEELTEASVQLSQEKCRQVCKAIENDLNRRM